jgi:hypothetical protein
MLKKAYFVFALLCSVNVSFAQTTFLPLGSEDYNILDRLETLSGRLCDSLAGGDRPESRRNAVNFLENLKAKNKNTITDPAKAPRSWMSNIDRYNLDQMISESGEWAPNENETIDSKHPWFNTFYKKQYNLAYIKTTDFMLDKDFFVVVNPVTNNSVLMQHNTPTQAGVSNTIFVSSRGAELRGWISRKLGFYTSITDNQEQVPYYVDNWIKKDGKHMAVPGVDYFLNPSKGHYDYMQASGYINFDVVKNHVNVTFGSGKHFIGDGISSLFLTDNSSNMPFLQIQTRIWKLNYECLYLELTPQFTRGIDTVRSHKYSTIHYLSGNVNRWLSLGFFEAEVFDRPDNYELSYLNPIIFTTAINRFNGAGDKSLLGMNAKAIIAKHVQLYGQLIFNEFRYKELTSSKKWYGNKYGVQFGAKYFDAAGIRNLDIQAEVDAVRPYTYSAQDTLANYTNYNQTMADPLGSGFIKTIGVLRYSPVKNLYLTLKGTYYIQGVDTGGKNFGNNIYNSYLSADHQYGVKWINGPKSTCEIINLNISYQLRRNLFIDCGGTYRKYINNAGIYSSDFSTTGPVYGPLTTNYVYIGFRINAVRRDYDFF